VLPVENKGLVLWNRQLSLNQMLKAQVSREVWRHTKNFSGFTYNDNFFRLLSYTVIKIHTPHPDPSPLLSYGLYWPETRRVKVHSHPRKPVFSPNYSVQLTYILYIINAWVAHGGWVPRNLGLELPTPNPGSKSTPKACPTQNPATSPARHMQPQPKHPSHRARSSVEIIKIMTINDNNNNNNKNK